MAILRPDPKILEAPYFGWVLKTESCLDQASRSKTGSAIRRIILKDLKRVKFPLPPLEEQKRIAGILDAADILRAKRASLAKLDDLLQSTFLDLFGDPVTNPKGWDRVKIGELVTKCNVWNPRTAGPETEFSYIDLSSIDKDRKLIVSTECYLGKEAPSRARQLVEQNDVLVSTVRPNLNGVALATKQHHGMTASTGFCVLRPESNKLESAFLFNWVKSKSFISEMVSISTGANYPAVSDGKVKSSLINLPPP